MNRVVTTRKKIAFLSPYPFDTAPGQRFRYEQYLRLLRREGYTLLLLSFLSESTFKILYKKGHGFQKAFGILYGFLRRIVHLFKIIKCDYIFIYREASPIGFPIFEWLISRVFRKKIIYDFDDAIWLPSTSQENEIVKKLKYPQKVGLICRWAYKVSVGNRYLQEFALQYNPSSILNPTTIDTTNYHNQVKDQDTSSIVIGWTGTHSTLVYLDMIYPVLKKLDEQYDFVFEVIADKEVNFDLKNFSFRKWNKQTEIQDLINFNIGLMPLSNDEWSKGKCGFKALQYMALGIPPVVSPVGVNSEIVVDGVNGFCCKTYEEWHTQLSRLIADCSLRKKLGNNAKARVHEKYSVAVNTSNFLSLFNK